MMFPTPSFVERVSTDLQRDLLAFLPELILCATIVALLLARLVTPLSRKHLGSFALLASGCALAFAICFWPERSAPIGSVPLSGNVEGFSSLLVFDTFGLYLRVFLLVFLCCSLWLSLLTGIPDAEDSADYYTLVIGGILGMMLMASANHLLMAFVAVEMASVPSYALAGFLKGRRQGSEAALKYVVYGASASGVMLYGISLLAGTFGTGSMPLISRAVAVASLGEGPTLPVLAGSICILIGLGFKLSAVPFHFWCPDVFSGAAAEVGAFLSVASKAAALALTARFLFVFSGSSRTGPDDLSGSALALGWAFMAAVTATFGNLAALAQTNIKRMLAYSTIAHAGIMMMALVAVGPRSVGPLLYYISGYLLMNLGAFAIVALVRNRTGSENLDAFRGLIRRAPLLAVGMSIFLLSLLGMPPLVGFAAKFQVFAVLYETGRDLGGHDGMIAWVYFGLLVVAALNTAISAGYYLKLVKVMTLEDPADPSPIRVSIGSGALVSILAGLVLAAGVFWNPLTQYANRASQSFDLAPKFEKPAKIPKDAVRPAIGPKGKIK
ncbi:MAG: NADH-quinone oxidoreductase subunit N [Gemmataceae bacterium]|nr:NADH-quinone oxidoreductase subunit N [Gemmataceae bacterium]